MNLCLQLIFALFICRDEKIVSRAIELNEQLQKVLARHDDLVSGRASTTASEPLQKVLPRHNDIVSGRATTTATNTRFNHEESDEEEEPEQLVRRCRLSCSRNSISSLLNDNPILNVNSSQNV